MVDFNGKNVLITGGTGFVGSHLVERLIVEGANVTTTYLTDNPNSYFSSKKYYKNVKMLHLDISNFDLLFDAVTKHEIDFIFHVAAQPLVEVAYDNPRRTLYSNIVGTVNVLESVRLYPKVKGVIIASSDKAYGKLKKNKYSENDPLRGDHPYEVSKSSADLIAQSYYKTYGTPVVITRFGNIYGEGDLNFSRIIPGLMRSIINHELLNIRSNGKYVRDYLYVKDVVAGYLFLVKNFTKIKGEVFNFGSQETLSVVDLINLVGRVLHIKVRYKILNIAKNEIPYQSLDYSKVQKLGWKQKYFLRKTIPAVYKWYRKIFKYG